MKRFLIFMVLILSVVSSIETSAQCAMCRTTLENNISQGNPGIAAGINFGILYLLATPYVAIAVIGFFWFRLSRRNKSRVDESAFAG
jgi:hypothetical protein